MQGFEQNFGWVIGLTGLYFFVILSMVLYARVKSTQSFLPGLNEFFLAGKSLHPLVLVCTYVGSLFSTFAVLGMPGLAYGHGIGAVLFQILLFPAPIFFLLCIGKRLRRFSEGKRVFSPVEILSQSYKSRRLGLCIALVFSIFLMPYISLQLVGIGTFLEAYTHGQITYLTGVGSMMGIVAIYLLLGGMRAVAYTDFIQLIAMAVGLSCGVLYLLHHYDFSLIELLHTAQKETPEHLSLPGPKGFYTYPMLITSSLVISGIFMQPHLLTRTLMAKNDREINLMALGSVIAGALIGFFALFYGLFAQTQLGSDFKPNLMMGHVFQTMAGFGLLGVIISTLMLMGALAVYKVQVGSTLWGVHVGFIPMTVSFILFFGISLLKGSKAHA